MTEHISQQFLQYFAERKQKGLYRSRQKLDTLGLGLDFSCNDYLSLATDPRVRKAYCDGFAEYPVGSGGSMVLSGYHAAHQTLERAFAEALEVDDCLLFSSGYVANLSVTRLLTEFGMHVVIDKAVHASIYDGLGLARANYSRFLHNNLASLAQTLIACPHSAVILTEGTFSMSGLHAPLEAMLSLVRQRQAHLIVDEAHSFGVIGSQGLGAVVAAGLNQDEVPLRIIPFGKALSGSGAIVAGKAEWIDALLQATRQPIYSTAISPAYAYGLTQVLGLVRQAEDRRAHLQELIQYFRELTQTTELRWRDSTSPIQQLQLGCPFLAQSYAEKLQVKQIRCFPIRQPTVPKAETGLRIIINYHHSFADIRRLFEVLQS